MPPASKPCYCYTCEVKVNPDAEKKCPVCRKKLWEAEAEFNDDNKIRTTKASYSGRISVPTQEKDKKKDDETNQRQNV